MEKIDKIIFIHTLNNYTGSPKVLSIVIKEFVYKGYEIELITSKGEGFLSNIPGVKYHFTFYRWYDEIWKTALLLALSQTILFLRILFSKSKGVLYYLNTITPFGAALACKISAKNFVYHVHENMQQSKPVYNIFRTVYKFCNRKSIFVSSYLKSTALNCRNGIVIYNSLDKKFISNAKIKRAEVRKYILMVSSLRKFKGIYEFVELARRLPQYSFQLVLSATTDEVDRFIKKSNIPVNLNVDSVQKDLSSIYSDAKLLLQLSHPREWVETFGMSILEGLVYGIPAIVPNVGGPTEIILDGVNGFLVNPIDVDDVQKKIEILMADQELYFRFSKNALLKSREFNYNTMISQIESYLL
jgi:glycosyltransferase involved in cell wall biosynthesis